MLNKSKYFSDT